MDSITRSETGDAPNDSQLWLRPELVASWPEIIAVAAVTIGSSTVVSGLEALRGSSRRFVTLILTDDQMLHTMAMEGAILGLLLIYLHRRGWRAVDFRILPDWRSTGLGLLLLPAMAVANAIVVITAFLIFFALQTHEHSFLTYISSTGPHLTRHSVEISWLSLTPAMILNGFFEEITTMGYVFNQFAAKRGPAFALALTVILRMSCHTYQGAAHALGVGAVFTVSGLVYWRTRNLWPLIFAHILADMISVSAIKFLFS